MRFYEMALHEFSFRTKLAQIPNGLLMNAPDDCVYVYFYSS